MSNFTPPLTFEDKIRAATKAQIPLPSQEFQTSLRERLFDQPGSDQKWYKMLKLKSLSPTKAFVYIVVVLTLLIVLIAGPKNISAAILNLLSYIPGIGFVETDRVLVEPVTIERDGIILTVQNMVVTEEETVLVYYVQNIPIGELGEYCEIQKVLDPSFNCTMSEPEYGLRDCDGKIFEGQPDSGHSIQKADGIDWIGRVAFPPLPVNVMQVDFLIDALLHMFPGMAPEDWVIPLSLQPTDEDVQLPVVYEPEIVVLTPEITQTPQSAADTSEIDPSTQFIDEIHLLVDAVTIQNGKITLSVSVQWESYYWGQVEVMDLSRLGATKPGDGIPHYLTLTDANGTQIPLDFDDLLPIYVDGLKKTYTTVLSGDVSGQELASPLTLSLSDLNVNFSFSHMYKGGRIEFSLDPGKDLLPGECVTISQELKVLDFPIEITDICSMVEVELNRSGGGGYDPDSSETPTPAPTYGLEIILDLPQDMLEISIAESYCLDGDHRGEGNCDYGSATEFSEEGKQISTRLFYHEAPTWPMEFTVMSVLFIQNGPWVIQFDIPGLEP